MMWLTQKLAMMGIFTKLCFQVDSDILFYSSWPDSSGVPGIYPNSCPLSRCCHPTIKSSVIPFSSCLQSFPTTGSFQMSQLFASGGQNTGVSASISVLPMNTQDRFPLGWTGWKSLNFYSNLQSNSPNTMRT